MVKTQGSNAYQDVYCGLQDRSGTLWFGTTGEGLYSYNGKGFQQYSVQTGLSSNTVWSILEDRKGNIWAGTSKGLCRLDKKTGKFVAVNIPGAPNNDAVTGLMEDRRGKIWIGAGEGVWQYNGISFTRFLNNPFISNEDHLTLNNIQCMFEDKEGKLWFGSGPPALEGLCMYSGKTLKKINIQNETWIRGISQDKTGRLLLTTRHRGALYLDGKNNITSFALPPNILIEQLTRLLIDKHGHVWAGFDYSNDRNISTGSCWRFDGKEYLGFTKEDGLTNTAVFFLLEDRNGNIWIGTRDTGLYRYNGQSISRFSE